MMIFITQNPFFKPFQIRLHESIKVSERQTKQNGSGYNYSPTFLSIEMISISSNGLNN